MSRIDEFSWGYEPAPKAVAAAVKPYTEMTSCAFKMIHAWLPLLPLLLSLCPSTTRFIPPITPAAAFPPVRPRRSGLRPRCRMQPNLEVNRRNACCPRMKCYSLTPSWTHLVVFVLSGTNMWPRSSAQAPVSPHYESSLISLVKIYISITYWSHMPEA